MDIGKGDEVITTTMSWLATANSIHLRGATPVFIDVNNDLNINPNLIETAITKKTKGYYCSSFFCGRICQIDKIQEIAKNNLYLIEDASQVCRC